MSEAEKKGSPWPWILVPVGAVSLFFVLRECRQNLPPANTMPEAGVTLPATPEAPATPDAAPAAVESAPDAGPAPQ